MQFNKKCAFFLVILVIVGTALRLYHLDFNSIWLDEASTYAFTLQPAGEYWNLLTSLGEVHPPLFYLFEKLALPLGKSEVALRIVPAVFGIATIPLFYMVGRKLVDDRVGLLMAVLITFSPFHIQYSQDARMYTVFLFFVALSLVFYLEAMKTGAFWQWTGFAVASSLVVWTHFFGFILFGALVLYALSAYLVKKQNLRNPGISVVIFLVISSPLFMVAAGIASHRIGDTLPTWGYTGDLFILKTIITVFSITPETLLGFIILFTIGLAWLYFEKRDVWIFIIAVIAISLAIGYFLSFHMPIDPRYFIFLLPFIYAAIASAALPFFQKIPVYPVMAVFTAVFILLWATQLAGYYTHPINQDWRGSANFLVKNVKPGDIIIVMPDYNRYPFNFYYDNDRYGTIQANISSIRTTINAGPMTCERSVYIVVTSDLLTVDLSGEATRWLSSRPVLLGNFNGVYVGKVPVQCQNPG